MTIKKYIFLHTLKRIRILLFLLLLLFHPISGYLRLFSRLQLVGGDWNETVKKQFFGSGGEVMNLAKNINSWYSRVMNLSQSTLSDL